MNTPQLVPSTPILATSSTPCELIWQTLAAAQRDHVSHVLGRLCCELTQQLTQPPAPMPPTPAKPQLPEVSHDAF